MSLKIWLPLDKSLDNQGLVDLTRSFNSAAINDNGKIGKCYYIYGVIYHLTNEVVQNQWTLCTWVKSSSWSTTNDIIMCKNISESTHCQFYFSIINGSRLNLGINGGSDTGISYSYTFNTNTWYHVAATYDGANCCLFINGEMVKTGTRQVDAFTDCNNLGIGCRSINTNGTSYTSGKNKYMNDVRIYDTALSPREIKEISKGLVLHYPLNRGGLGPSNLIKNGFGELGSENWTSSTSISTTDIPSGQSDIKASFSGGYTIEHIRIYPTHNYKFSTWIKATATSGNTYPSLYPYDVDGKFIDYFKCSVGFNLNTMTTLKQELKSGDTKIYVNDLSQWNANSGHYYNWAAIFGYKDSTGHTYPDGTYTQNCVRFGNSTNEKTNLDKTNNIITLTSAYTGPTMPIGTKLCASTEGATYYYPLGGINLSTIQDWTYKEVVFSGNDARLRYAKTVIFWTYTNNRMAGIKIVDLTYENMDSTIEYDCSGYCNNGTRVGTFSWSSDTPRYNVSTYVSSSSSINHHRCLSNDDQEWTCCAWVKLDGSTSNQQLNNFNVSNAVVYVTTPILYLNGGADDYYMYGSQVVPVDEWTHIAFVFKNSTGLRNIYINGVLKNNQGPNKTSTPRGIPDSVTLFGQNFAGYVSDYREYATALSVDDILELYHTPITLSSNGSLFTQGEIVES